MTEVSIYCGRVANGVVGMTAVLLPRKEDVAKVMWAEEDDRGWSWPGAGWIPGTP